MFEHWWHILKKPMIIFIEHQNHLAIFEYSSIRLDPDSTFFIFIAPFAHWWDNFLVITAKVTFRSPNNASLMAFAQINLVAFVLDLVSLIHFNVYTLQADIWW